MDELRILVEITSEEFYGEYPEGECSEDEVVEF